MKKLTFAAMVVSVVVSCIGMPASAQSVGGGYGGGKTVYIEVVLMVGPGYDAKRQFVDAVEVYNATQAAQSPMIPLHSIRVSATPCPTESGTQLIGEYPNEWEDEQIESFRKGLELRALKYGIHISQAVKGSGGSTRRWIRAGVRSKVDLQAQISRLSQIAIDLNEGRPRIDLFQLPAQEVTAPASVVAEKAPDYGGYGSYSSYGGTAVNITNASQTESSGIREKLLETLLEYRESYRTTKNAQEKEQLRELTRFVFEADANQRREAQQKRIESIRLQLVELERSLQEQLGDAWLDNQVKALLGD